MSSLELRFIKQAFKKYFYFYSNPSTKQLVYASVLVYEKCMNAPKWGNLAVILAKEMSLKLWSFACVQSARLSLGCRR